MNEYCKIKMCIFVSSSVIKTLVPCLIHQYFYIIFFIIIVISYLHYITIILNMTVLFKSDQFNCLSVCHTAIICIIIIFVNYLASKINEK